MVFARTRPSFITIVWLVIGVIVAANRGYFETVNTVETILSAILAVIAWPLVLLNINVAI